MIRKSTIAGIVSGIIFLGCGANMLICFSEKKYISGSLNDIIGLFSFVLALLGGIIFLRIIESIEVRSETKRDNELLFSSANNRNYSKTSISSPNSAGNL